MTDRIESLGEGSRSKNRPRTWLGFVKPIRNRLRKKQNLIKRRPSKTETGFAREEKMEIESEKSKRDRIMRSKNFETQVREIRRNKAESREALHLMDGGNRRCLPDGKKGM